VRPCQMVVVPGLVVSPRELTRANLVMGYCERASALVGPLIASALIAIGGTRLALLVMAMLVSLCTISAWPLVRFDADVQPSAVVSRPTRVGALADGLRSLAERRGAKQLLLVLTAQYVLIGALDLICVVLADEAFGLGPAGPGLLSAMFGAGAVIGAACSTLLVARRRLAPVLLVSLAAICGALVVMGAWAMLGPVVVALVVAGVGRSILDVTGRMLLQRSAPQHALASIFATLEPAGSARRPVGHCCHGSLDGDQALRMSCSNTCWSIWSSRLTYTQLLPVVAGPRSASSGSGVDAYPSWIL